MSLKNDITLAKDAKPIKFSKDDSFNFLEEIFPQGMNKYVLS